MYQAWHWYKAHYVTQLNITAYTVVEKHVQEQFQAVK